MNSELFWLRYLNFEEKVVKLTEYIAFNDEQKTVYSPYIADLIIQIGVEIEALSKEVFRKYGGQWDSDSYPKFDKDCLSYLEQSLSISQKIVNIANPLIEFSSSKLYPFKGFNYTGARARNWKKAYMALRHNRIESIRLASIENLILILSALYLLNQYERDLCLNLGFQSDYKLKSDTRFGSKIFSLSVFDSMKMSLSFEGVYNWKDEYNEEFRESVYLIIFSDEALVRLKEILTQDAQIIMKNYSEVKREFPDIDESNKNFLTNLYNSGGMNLVNKVFTSERRLKYEYGNLSVIEKIINKKEFTY